MNLDKIYEEINQEIKVIEESESPLIRKTAELYIKLDVIKKEIDTRMKTLSVHLLENQETVYVPTESKKVTYIEGKDKSEINTHKLGSKLLAMGKIQDFFNMVKVTEKAVKEYDYADEVLTECKETTGKTSPSIRVSNMTKKELKEHLNV